MTLGLSERIFLPAGRSVLGHEDEPLMATKSVYLGWGPVVGVEASLIWVCKARSWAASNGAGRLAGGLEVLAGMTASVDYLKCFVVCTARE